jgi:DDE domain
MIAGRQFWLWRAVDDEGEVLDLLVQRRRDRDATVKLVRKQLKKQGFGPEVLVTDKLRSYGAARSEIVLSARHEQGMRKNNRAENSHQPTRGRERKMQRFKSPGSAQTIPVRSRRRPQHVQRPASSLIPPHAGRISSDCTGLGADAPRGRPVHRRLRNSRCVRAVDALASMVGGGHASPIRGLRFPSKHQARHR